MQSYSAMDLRVAWRGDFSGGWGSGSGRIDLREIRRWFEGDV